MKENVGFVGSHDSILQIMKKEILQSMQCGRKFLMEKVDFTGPWINFLKKLLQIRAEGKFQIITWKKHE